ncbi:DUF2970 domain-containing protein [Nitrosomonas sp.]|uniref:DUF2970 domain-containing protein n=1 Tax=Nitrosomonas sp. TaxID=42353 RepID=UPI001DFC51D3|nr:DUF2970 domain-containing protein [Nitrosomonas sp.]MCB1948896.1 DUF2970 domain-containing protein [Nitrosomonas sp.]MDR4513750.1 DUF2970 domain-containing protein [Nitrosomonas sp.]
MSKDEKTTSTTIVQVAKAVLAAFMGIRRQSDLENDAANLKPAQVIIGGLIGALIFVISLLLLVKIIVN